MRHIYDIVECILDCAIIFSRILDGQDSDDEDTRWRKVSTDKGILGGVAIFERL
jgi:hypothetical protein